MRDGEGEGREGEAETGCVEGGETIVKAYCLRNECIFKHFKNGLKRKDCSEC